MAYNMLLAERYQVTKDLISQTQDYFCLQVATIRAEFSNPTIGIYLSCIVIPAILVFAVVFPCFRRRRSKKQSLHPLTSLLQVITPACSLWPRTYMKLSEPHRLQIPLATLIEDITAGTIELRAPEEDLKQLVAGKGRLKVEGGELVLSVGFSLKLKVLWWWTKSTMHTGRNKSASISGELNVELMGSNSRLRASGPRVETAQNHYSGLMDHSSRPDSVLPALLPTLPVHVLDKLAVAITLDSISPAYLENTLLAVPPGSLALFEFTNSDPRVFPGSIAWVFSVLSLACAANASRTASLPGILGLLEGVCTVLSVQNVSAQYAQLLEDYAHGLDTGAVRRLFLREEGGDTDEGMRAWRAEKFWTHWGAACYASGGLVRWIVCVRRLPS